MITEKVTAKGEAAMSTWIYRITINTCISCFRHTRRHADTVTLDPQEMLAVADNATDSFCLQRLRRVATLLRVKPVTSAIS